VSIRVRMDATEDDAWRRFAAAEGGEGIAWRGTSRQATTVKEILTEIERWQHEGEDVVVATVVANRRTAPRPVGSSLAISRSGKLCGSVSGGCVEGDVFQQAQDVFASGEPKLLSYGISDEEAWDVGLPCGGEIDVFIERLP
jgi:xanthine/CO dehydrogenase XdhC/CoxF family maturation factor